MSPVKKVLIGIIFILLISFYVACDLILDEIKEDMANIDYTIYDVEDHSVKSYETDGIFSKLKESLIPYTKECDYKYYQKMKLVNYCNCTECSTVWKWPSTEEGKIIIPEFSVAANPETFTLGTRIKTNYKEFLVCWVDESIPADTIYVYTKVHDNDDSSLLNGIWDVYKEK